MEPDAQPGPSTSYNDDQTTVAEDHQPAKAPSAPSGYSGIVVNEKRQKGNPVLKYIRNVRYDYGTIGADFECGSACGVVFLTMKFHRLHPSYVHSRLCGSEENKYVCKVLLVVCNVDEPRHHLRELNLICHRFDWSFILCYSIEEAGEYLENLRMSEIRDPVFKSKQGSAPVDERAQLYSAAVGIITGARSVTKADAGRLLFNFGTLKNICEATEEQLALCPGLGPIRAKNLYTYLRTDFCT